MPKKTKLEVTEVRVVEPVKPRKAKAKQKKDGRGRPARTQYQKVLLFIVKLFGSKLKAYLIKKVF